MTKLTFLYASVPLTKRIVKNRDGSITKDSYPHVANFTSKTHTVKSLNDMFEVVQAAVNDPAKPCLLKGTIQRELRNESRAGSTSSNTNTTWVCFDLDKAPFSSPEEFMLAMKLDDVSYIIQYSSSYKLNPKDKTLSCHIICMLDKAMQPSQLKAWLMYSNFTLKPLRNALTLTNSAGSGLHFSLDITLCQNDRLLYIAEPIFVNMTSPIKTSDRLKLVKKSLATLPHTRIALKALDALTKEKREIWNQLREAAGMKKITTKSTQQGEYTIQKGLGEVNGYEVFDSPDSEFIYYNFMRTDGVMGDSRAYYHPRNNFELIHNFKGEDSMLMKEVMPERYAELTRELKGDLASVSEDGDVMLAFRNSEDSEYYSCLWNAEAHQLWLKRVKSKDALNDWVLSHGRNPGPFIPTWEITFDPQSDTVVDVEGKTINTFICPPLLRCHTEYVGKSWDSIRALIEHVLGGNKDCVEHFLNHLAVVFQKREKPGTAWVLHGIEGCLAGETKISVRRGKRTGGKDREISIKHAFEKWTGTFKQGAGSGKTWDMSIPTFSKSVKDGMTVGYHEVYDIVEAGVKQLYKLTTNTGRTIRVTDIHPFMRPEGTFTELKDLRIGDHIVVEGSHNNHVARVKGRNKARSTTYSIPHHPYGWKNIVGGKDYKRIHTARLIVEADLNGLTLQQLITILRNDPITAEKLVYLAPDVVVHHLDEDPSNDALSNLVLIDKLNHDKHHAKEVGLGTISTELEIVTAIEIDKMEMTYDMTMKAPYQNYIANGFAVHNTGKGILVNVVLRGILGHYVAIKPAGQLEDQFNEWIERALIGFIDEIEADALTNKSTEGMLRNMVTEPTFSVRRMREAAKEVRSYTMIIMSANRPQPVRIPPNDRRYNVGDYQTVMLKEMLSTRYNMTPIEFIKKLQSELGAFTHYLMTRKACATTATTALMTEAKAKVQELSLTSIDETARALLTGDFEQLHSCMPDENLLMEMGDQNIIARGYAALMKRWSEEAITRATRDELGVIFEHCCGGTPRSPNKLTSMLRHHGISTKKMKVDNGAFYGLEIEWQTPSRERKALMPTTQRQTLKRVK